MNVLLAIVGALFAYYKFFREGSHRQRIEFDLDLKDLGIIEGFRVIEVGVLASNKGHIEQKFDSIKLKIRGIEFNQELFDIEGHEPRLAFPEKIDPVSVISKKYKYYFVRPGVTQRFPVVVKIPKNWRLVQARSTFKYFSLDEIHTAERSFALAQNNA